MKKQVLPWFAGVISSLVILASSVAEATPAGGRLATTRSLAAQSVAMRQPSPMLAAKSASGTVVANMTSASGAQVYLALSGVPAGTTTTVKATAISSWCKKCGGITLLVVLLCWTGLSTVVCVALFFMAARPMPRCGTVAAVDPLALAQGLKQAARKRATPTPVAAVQQTSVRRHPAAVPV